jgi:hypothetical protein
MWPTAAIMEEVRWGVFVDGTSTARHRLGRPVGMDCVVEAGGRRWQVIGVVRRNTEMHALCVPDRP